MPASVCGLANHTPMHAERSVALIGRPNVGKSRLFNRLVGRRLAIVHNEPGITRDVKTAPVEEGDYTLMDTGGIGLVDETNQPDLLVAVEEQAHFAIEAATLVLLVVDAKEGRLPLDQIIAERLHRAGKLVQVIVNKVDTPAHEDRIEDFAALGLGNPLLVSAEQNRGISQLCERIATLLGPPYQETEIPEERRIKISFVGRPNVGKSSLCNRLLAADRLVVSEVPGTTRDSVELDLDYHNPDGGLLRFRLIDTAGIRHRRKVKVVVEYFSALRSERAMAQSDVVFLVLDAREGVTTQDQNLAGKALEAGRALAIVVNKWDYALETFARAPLPGYRDEADFRQRFAKAVHKGLFFLPHSPILFVSARTGLALDSILATAVDLDRRAGLSLATGPINRLLQGWLAKREPRLIQGQRFKLYYAVQTGTRPQRLRFFCNRGTKLEDSYRRYLERSFITAFGLDGCPIQFDLVGKAQRFKRA